MSTFAWRRGHEHPAARVGGTRSPSMAMPGGTNRYSARVQIHGNAHSERWSGGDHGGLLNGTITHQKQ